MRALQAAGVLFIGTSQDGVLLLDLLLGFGLQLVAQVRAQLA